MKLREINMLYIFCEISFFRMPISSKDKKHEINKFGGEKSRDGIMRKIEIKG